MADESLTKNAARGEVRSLLKLLETGSGAVEQVRVLIAVDPKSEAWLRAFAKAHKEEEGLVESVLRFRAAVLSEFNFLVETISQKQVEEECPNSLILQGSSSPA
jgi:hypothetical protein